MVQRTQSPSSINMYKQCPRKYYYRYIERLPTKPSIHLVRGTIAHSVLERFFDDIPDHEGDWKTTIQLRLLKLLEQYWQEHDNELQALDETPEELTAYKQETQMMLINWNNYFVQQMQELLAESISFPKAFRIMTPEREAKYVDEELKVMGYIDAIETDRGRVALIDYKTSKKPVITPEYRLQLGIYALMYLRRHSKLPEEVGIHFLRHHREVMRVNDELLLDAQFEIEQVHSLTKTKDITDYPKNVTPLCNWCDYYEQCFGKKKH